MSADTSISRLGAARLPDRTPGQEGQGSGPDTGSLPEKGARIAGLDVLRGLATLMVVFAHVLLCIPHYLVFQSTAFTWRVTYLSSCLVECFFALSGFLIGGALLRYASFDRTRIYNYTVDRATRILPAYYVILALVALTFPHLGGIHEPGNISYVFFAQCWFGNLYLLGTAWTLSIEVLSYILLPILIYFARFRIRLCRDPYMTVIVMSLALIALETLLRFLVVWCIPDIAMDEGVRKQTHLRLDALFYGLVVACLKQVGPTFYHRLASPLVCLLAFLGMLLVGEWQYADLFIRGLPDERHRALHALLDFTCTGILAASVLPFFESIRLANANRLVYRLCTFLQYIAKISYSLYLLHLPFLSALLYIYGKIVSQNALLNNLYFVGLMLPCLAICFILSDKTFNYIEKPGMNLRKKLRKPVNG